MPETEIELTDAELRAVVRHMPTMAPGHALVALQRDVERIIAARQAPVWAILNAWEAWDGSPGPDGRIHPDSSSPRDRDRLRAALTLSPAAIAAQAAINTTFSNLDQALSQTEPDVVISPGQTEAP